MAPAFMSCSDKIMRNDGSKKIKSPKFRPQKSFLACPPKILHPCEVKSLFFVSTSQEFSPPKSFLLWAAPPGHHGENHAVA
jgi:hypothetical protein